MSLVGCLTGWSGNLGRSNVAHRVASAARSECWREAVGAAEAQCRKADNSAAHRGYGARADLVNDRAGADVSDRSQRRRSSQVDRRQKLVARFQPSAKNTQHLAGHHGDARFMYAPRGHALMRRFDDDGDAMRLEYAV